jgi:hypothetical protein
MTWSLGCLCLSNRFLCDCHLYFVALGLQFGLMSLLHSDMVVMSSHTSLSAGCLSVYECMLCAA